MIGQVDNFRNGPVPRAVFSRALDRVGNALKEVSGRLASDETECRIADIEPVSIVIERDWADTIQRGLCQSAKRHNATLPSPDNRASDRRYDGLTYVKTGSSIIAGTVDSDRSTVVGLTTLSTRACPYWRATGGLPQGPESEVRP